MPVKHQEEVVEIKSNNPADNAPGASTAHSYLQRWQSGQDAATQMLVLLLAAFMQGIALPVFIRSLMRCLRETRQPYWAMAFSVAAIVTLVLTPVWPGLRIPWSSAQATRELRLRLGEQLRRVPLEKLQRGRAGEMNALLLGSVMKTSIMSLR